MSKQQFEDILAARTYTNVDAPDFLDQFHQVRQMIDSWNTNLEEKFSPSWITCLDESMMVWTNEFCPGFMVVPRKPKPFGNEFQSICCCLSGILFHIKLVEGKDHPPQRPMAYEKTDGVVMKTVGLLLCMTKPIWGTGKVVIMDSGFCVLRG